MLNDCALDHKLEPLLSESATHVMIAYHAVQLLSVVNIATVLSF